METSQILDENVQNDNETGLDGVSDKKIFRHKEVAGIFIVVAVFFLLIAPRIEIAMHSNLNPSYTWTFKGKTFTSTFHFSWRTYLSYAIRSRTDNMVEYTAEASDYKYMDYVAGVLYKNIEWENYTNKDIADYLLAFVQQCIPYKKTEEGMYPIEVLVLGTADCKGKSCLYVSLLRAFAIRSALIELPHHLAVAVDYPCKTEPFCLLNGKKLYYAETTFSGWAIGAEPRDCQNASFVLLLEPAQTTAFQRPGIKHPPIRSESRSKLILVKHSTELKHFENDTIWHYR